MHSTEIRLKMLKGKSLMYERNGVPDIIAKVSKQARAASPDCATFCLSTEQVTSPLAASTSLSIGQAREPHSLH